MARSQMIGSTVRSGVAGLTTILIRRGMTVKQGMAAVVLMSSMAMPAMGGGRKFAFSYEATTTPKRQVEYEHFVTWKTSKSTDSDFDQIDVRHEIELGLTDRLQMGIYQADWRYRDGESVSNNRIEYRDTAFEFIYNLASPVEDPIGLALYGEIKIGDQFFELEGKIIVQKDVGPWTFAYNATIEAEWEGSDYEEDKGVFEQTAGVSYQILPSVSAGIELLHEVEFDDWEQTGHNVVYLGPNMSYRHKGWFVTVTPLFQLSDIDSEADFVTRMIFGMHF